jgi:signal transduction histidine kinase
LRPDGDRRGVIPLHGGAAAERTDDASASRGPWDPELIVFDAPAPLRLLIVDLLGAAGVADETLRDLRRRLPERSVDECTPDEMGAAVTLVRAAVERASVAGAPADVTRTRHACLDAASVAWAEDALERRSTRQRHLLRDVSHDIRSPLNSILFLADALRSGHSGELNGVQKRQVDVLFMAAVTLVKLVNDLIDYAHLDDTAEITVADTAFSAGSVVDEVRGLLGPLLEYHEVELMVDQRCDAPRKGDARLLNRILLNLVSNAIQAMPEGGHVHIELDADDDGGLEVRVEDDGPGVDLAEIRDSLAAAVRGASLAETDGWTHGLGLSISARLAHAAGGRLAVEPNEPRGTRFRVTLPFEAI